MEAIDQETGEVVETRPVTVLAKVAPQGASRLLALDSMDEADFKARLAVLSTGQSRMRRIQKELLGDGDFGVVPGTHGKPTLFKAGAEKLLKFYGLVSTFATARTLGDGVDAPHLHVMSACRIHVGDAGGPVVAEGEGTCNTWERKYRYRRDGSVNPDPLDLDNTIVKMARKRALVDATLLATATSGLFSQDLEDMEQDPASLPPAERMARMLTALSECVTLKDFDALAAEMAPAVTTFPQDLRDALRERSLALRKPLFQAAKAEHEARQAKPEPAPEPAPVDPPEPAPPAPDGDGPPPDEDAALALIEPMNAARTVSVAQKLWARIEAGQDYAAATPGAKVLAKANADALIAAIRDEQRAKGGQ